MPSVTSCTLKRVFDPSSVDQLNRSTYVLTYDIKTDGILGPKTLRTQAETASPHPLPSYGSTYSYQGETDAAAYAQGFSFSPHENQQNWVIGTVGFQPLPDDNDPTIFEPNPFLRSPIGWWDREAYNKIFVFDNANKRIANKAHKPYELGPEKQLHRGILVATYNVATLAEVGITMGNYIDRTNSSPWTVLGWQIPSRCALCQDVASGPPIKQGAYTYYALEMRFIFDLNTFDEPLVEQGYQALLKKDGEYEFVNPTAPDDEKIFKYTAAEAEPFLLAEDGTRLGKDLPGVTTKWRLYKEANFNALPFSG